MGLKAELPTPPHVGGDRLADPAPCPHQPVYSSHSPENWQNLKEAGSEES